MAARAMPRQVSRLVVLAILAAVVLGAVAFVLLPGQTKTVQARFERAVGLYTGSDVRLHGIKIGSITKVTPDGDGVVVRMKYRKKIKLPAYPDDAKVVRAAIIPPSLVSDRYVQLADFDSCTTGCPVLASGAAIPMNQTAAPVELDDIYAALDKLNVALGPKGANATSLSGDPDKGPLSDLIDVGAANLDGNGAALGSTVADLAKAVRTLAEGREDLFGTVKNLQVFTDALVANDAQVRAFNTQLDQVSAALAEERGSLAAALKNLTAALRDIAGFIQANGDAIHTDVAELKDVVGTLNKQKAALNEVLAVAPVALENLNHTYNPRAGTLDTRDNLGGIQNPLDPAAICAALSATKNLPASGPIADTCAAIAKVIGGLPPLGGTPSLPPIGLPPLGGS
jgi:phospholipid/cholesterol/gamma-HCH transport system substrate-binding protein